MIVTRSFMNQVWTDLNSPTKEELDSLMLTENLDPLILKDLLAPTPKQYAKEFDQGIYAVLHIPFFKHSHSVSVEQEIDFIITERGLITARYDSIDAVHYFGKQVEVNEVLQKQNGSHLFFGLMKEIYRFLFDEIDYTKDWLKEIDKNIFEGYEKEMVFSISAASRNILSLQRTIGPHELVIKKLITIGKNRFGESFEREALIMLDEWQRLIFELKNISDMLYDLRETNNSILSTKQNEIMKIFTILAFVTFPLSLIAAIFGMNTSFIPIVGLSYDFWLVIGLMILISLAMFSYFKYKKWM